MASLAMTSAAVVSLANAPSVAHGSLASRSVTRPVRLSLRWHVQRSSSRVMMSSGPKIATDLSDQISGAIKEAEEVCADPGNKGECAAAWDDVEELSAAAADQKLKQKQPHISDPLEAYCQDNPETDECRIYSD